MATERRNLYRLLYVQPEAPPEVIKAAYRALMSTLRAHPDLGGDHDVAARLNAAYHVLGHPERRREYDLTLKKPSRGPAASAQRGSPAGADFQPGVARRASAAAASTATGSADDAAPAYDAQAWLLEQRCPFCRHALASKPGVDVRCTRCDGPLCPVPQAVPTAGGAGTDPNGRRATERFVRDAEVRLRLPGVAAEQGARLKDLSLTGLALQAPLRINPGSVVHVLAGNFETLALVVACRGAAGGQFSLHMRLLTLQLQRAARGVYVNARA